MSRLTNSTSAFRDSLRLLVSKRYGTFWFASLLSNLGTWAQQVAEPWLLLSLGASPFLIGLDSFATNAPVWALTLAGGLLADRADRRSVIAIFQSVQMLCPTLIAVLLVTGGIGPAVIIACSLVVGITDALSMPSFQSIVPSIVARAEIPRALALNSTQFNLSRILGPAIAGVLMASVGAFACFALSAASYLPFIGVALWILPRRLRALPGTVAQVRSRNPFAGFGAIVRSRQLRAPLLTVLTTSVLCSPLVTFCPVLVSAGFKGDATRFSLAVGAFGAGGLLGALALLSVPPKQDRRRLSSLPALAYAVVVVAAAVLPWFWGLPALMVLAGAAMTLSNTSANSMLQSISDPGLLGRTASLYMLAMRGGISVGSLLTGFTISLLGVRYALLANGVLAVALHVAIGVSWARAPVPGALVGEQPLP